MVGWVFDIGTYYMILETGMESSKLGAWLLLRKIGFKNWLGRWFIIEWAPNRLKIQVLVICDGEHVKHMSE